MRPTDDRIDLSPLDPEAEPDRLDRVVNHVLERLGPGIVRDDEGVVDEVSRYLVHRVRAICAAAAIVVLVSFVARSVGPDGRIERISASAPELSVPTAWDDWLSTGQTPTAEELLLSLAGSAQ